MRSRLWRHPGESRGPGSVAVPRFRRLPRTWSGVRRNDGRVGFL